MTNDELLRLVLTVYGNSRQGMPAHQALEVADRALADADDALTADDALRRFDDTFRTMFGGG